MMRKISEREKTREIKKCTQMDKLINKVQIAMKENTEK